MRLNTKRLKEVLFYDPETGIFMWKISSRKTTKYQIINSRKGYFYIGIGGKKHAANRLAFLYMKGRWPIGKVYHNNGLPSDYRWDNLSDGSRTAPFKKISRKKRTSEEDTLILRQNIWAFFFIHPNKHYIHCKLRAYFCLI